MNSKRLNIVGAGEKSEQEVFRSLLKHWRQKLGYWSIVVSVPALVISQLQQARPAEAKKTEPHLAARAGRTEKVKSGATNRTLLERQSNFPLPHELTTLPLSVSDRDDCPGKMIPEGQYTAASPYVDSGDTTGANDTVTHAYFIDYTYYNHNAFGPDHVYSFVISSRGPNPKIRVVATSGTYQPLIYVLRGDAGGGCPAGTGNHAFNELVYSDARWSGSNQATLDSFQVNYLPGFVRLYLVVDSAVNDSSGSGAYRLEMQDMTISGAALCTQTNVIDCPEFFARQHYLDFLDREPETDGINAWLRVLNNCGLGDLNCRHEQRLTTSAAFFGSTEFHLKGYFVFRFYRTAFGRLPEFHEILEGMRDVSGQTPNEVYTRKATFTNAFAQRQEFLTLFTPLPNAEYVSALLSRYGLSSITTPDPLQPDGTAKVTLTQSQLVSHLGAGTITRAQVLRAIADSDQVIQAEFNPAFVAMQYFGYLRRTPESNGYHAWLNYLNANPGDFREMVRGFVDSTEYRRRFGQP